jgi:hypothetical protein
LVYPPYSTSISPSSAGSRSNSGGKRTKITSEAGKTVGNVVATSGRVISADSAVLWSDGLDWTIVSSRANCAISLLGGTFNDSVTTSSTVNRKSRINSTVLTYRANNTVSNCNLVGEIIVRPCWAGDRGGCISRAVVASGAHTLS